MSISDKPVLDVRVTERIFKLEGGRQLHAVGTLNFSLIADSFTCIVGPSGCGKTTTLRMILGLDPGYVGHIDQPQRELVAAVFQEPRLLPWRTVEQNVRLVLPKPRAQESLDDLFEALGIIDVRTLFPNQLSLGLARRVALARAFVLQPRLLVLDEPFVSLDDETASRLRALLMSVWQSQQTTALMVTHNIREAVLLADRIMVFSERPTTVLDVVELDAPRSSRSEQYIDAMVARVKAVVS